MGLPMVLLLDIYSRYKIVVQAVLVKFQRLQLLIIIIKKCL
jgi:hypothetical protein